MMLTLSRSQFKKGFDDTLTLRPLRRAVGLVGRTKQDEADQNERSRVIVVEKNNKTWNVKRAS